MKLFKTFIYTLLCLSMIFISCSKDEESAKESQQKKILDIEFPTAESLISAYTSGIISRESTIRIRFIEDIVDQKSLGTPLGKSPFEFQPDINGNAMWIDSNTLEFQPVKRLPGGQKYEAKVKLFDLMEVSKDTKPFDFEFTTMKQSFAITIDGLSSKDQNKPEKQQLIGRIVTADSENNPEVEKVLTAFQGNNQLQFKWTHSQDKSTHTFLIDDISRGDIASSVVLKWNGNPINVDKKGDKNIPVPPLQNFEVSGAKAIFENEQYIEVRFTDPLLKKQNLNNLITVNDKSNLKFTIQQNMILVYSSTQWTEDTIVKIYPGIRNANRNKLKKQVELDVYFGTIMPNVRFTGKGVIVPTTQGLTIPIEAINLRAVTVEAIQVFEKNIPQFLQVNRLDGTKEMSRVGRTVWKKTISLGAISSQINQWNRFGLDMTPLLDKSSDGLFRLVLSFKRRHIIYDCPETEDGPESDPEEMTLTNASEQDESSSWDSYEPNNNWDEYYENRDNPCHPAYYRATEIHNIKASRNVLISDIGLIVKKGDNNSVYITTTDIQTAKPLSKTEVVLLDYQQQIISQGSTDENGMAELNAERKPFLLVAKHNNQSGYLKLDDGLSLSTSHFDVSGKSVKKGLKGFIYGERGVWRPGDAIYLTFILMDTAKTLPENHPVNFSLINPRGQQVKSMVRRHSINGFYSFKTETSPDAPTGDWIAKISVGGVNFEKLLKIETIMPNRLKIKFDFGKKTKSLRGGKISCDLSSTWLHGAIAKNLKSDVELKFSPRKTGFTKFDTYVFDDPVRKYEPESDMIFEGALDETGKTTVTAEIRAKNISPGMLTANFKTRVFEPGGAFSVDRFSIPFHPYDNYVGIRLPKGDKARGMLLTDTDHEVGIVMVDPDGKPVKSGEVEVEMYKIKWRWWWEKGRESIADYLGSSSYTTIQEGKVKIKDGKGTWTFNIKYPSWGRYLVRAKNLEGKHSTGKIVYVDWPGWAGRAQDDNPDGAGVLTFAADKSEYNVGEKVQLTIPSGKEGRGLISIESGGKIIKAQWVEGGEESIRFEFDAEKSMTPNAYVHVTFLQPHMQTLNDLPIRMYGVIPVKVTDPETRMQPVLKAPDVFAPEETSVITVNEANGKPMTYTVAVVDEGLLGLTRFKTPDPWNNFYQREALSIKTWDLFDRIAGAYGGTLEQLLSIGGGDEAEEQGGKKKSQRFPPMVRFLGPFELGPDAKNTHEIDIPQYIGSVRTMIVAGQDRAFGTAEKAVFVRKPIMVLGTLPRVLGPEEEVELPISVFALEEKVKEVTVMVDVTGPITILGKNKKKIAFSDIGDDLINFKLKVGTQPGKASINIKASGAGESTGQKIDIQVRMPGGQVSEVVDSIVEESKTWEQEISYPGLAGTNQVMLEVSRIPPINLGKRLNYLIRYPHGCVEQVTSSVFPQLYLDKLLKLSPEKQDKIQKNIKAGISRLRRFQASDGGFAYWPGAVKADEWATNYAGHFMIEAEKAGYMVPLELKAKWKNYQRHMSASWVTGPARSELIQAYRVYTLALAGESELGAMNRLKEEEDLPPAARWRLAAAYQLAGQPEAADDLIKNTDISIPAYRELGDTYGSDLRDKAMILESLSIMGKIKKAAPLGDALSKELADKKWLSTQTTAYALIAMAKYAGLTGKGEKMSFDLSWNKEKKETISSISPVIQRQLNADKKPTGKIKLKNTCGRTLFSRLILEGFPAVGKEKPSKNGMRLSVQYMDLNSNIIDPSDLEQGTDLVVEVSVRNTGQSGTYEEVALSHILPSGWEIHNERMDKDRGEYVQEFDYRDVRDDRVYTYFDLPQQDTTTFRVHVNASYLGKYYLPMVNAEAMYDATIHARTKGQWIKVSRPYGSGEESESGE